ncbi:bifunctional glutamate N-acetyltransferase/amino-acid acetyltransferase ArgJ [Ectothiorhodospira lacustris]|uniref:bifunctional glutamate N-acetyltransferase/amino-acid acetyltransferase ArgJ n=1 Tax=Ectothiorhodospira lacustris TaxID=2899127 RepID=UPI001EE86D38|nr:bifunctional glutamate N-acetyltransferase/amino-acid acetyltransferase ArgJ [Ectothiorhodospira lacustris]MCG5500997.1 bifunctional glutamate N-acetyltransferase/amino-acid acetyltransferase ArgJ [Ectothiorhodospira lacustris]MCG5510549.1 bifunctional glutamate N-acetyltransferase/amino-acid acetyltransferase ArgJ [Ectothiorhodospira lacustris]MCG5521241.1 bifunctional glutamate N-acetyltransferase/amino-acid acetyltransferase ArgJ [Ectothiorhodospira lacustris]
MAVNLSEPVELAPVSGVRLSAVAAGIRYQGRNDLVLMELATGSTCAAVFTRNAFCAAPVQVARQHLLQGAPRYLLINAGNANAGTGTQGLEAAYLSCGAVAGCTNVRAAQVLPFSTGVIGEPLPVDRISAALPEAVAALDEQGWMPAMRAIMTTDTVGKGASETLRLSGGEVTLTGIAKGSGMIHPDMATMLAFLATDALLDKAVLQAMLLRCTDASFNAITVDGDTSTNDACVLAATGASGVSVDSAEDQALFEQALLRICRHLAHAIVRDGEGATKFITVRVSGARDAEEARRVGFAVALSPLVKTALFASDPNWGRILAAVGRAGVKDLDVDRVTIHLDDVRIVANGGRALEYEEAMGRRVMAGAEILIHIDLGGPGETEAEVYTCDFSYDYVRINAEYRS